MTRRWRRVGVTLAALTPLLSVACGAPVTSLTASSTAVTSTTRLCDDYLGRTITVDVLGDSIMAGNGASDTQHTWSTKLDGILGVGSVRQYAYPGTVTSDFLPGGRFYSRTQAVMNDSPTVAVVDWRLNEQDAYTHNLPGSASPDQLRDNLTALINLIHSTTPSTTVLVVNPPIALDGRDVDLQRWYVGGMWVAKVNTDSLWLDLALYFPATLAQDDIGMLAPDHLHVSDVGQAVMAAVTHQRLHGTCAR